jgi:hypothetical protein
VVALEVPFYELKSESQVSAQIIAGKHPTFPTYITREANVSFVSNFFLFVDCD